MASITDGPLTSLAFCWRIERGDGAGIALTSCDRDLQIGGITYRSAPGGTPAAISRTLGLEADSGEIAGGITADSLSEADLVTGRWNRASLALDIADWRKPDAPRIRLLGGEIGEVSVEGDGFSAELRGAASRLSRAPCPSTSSECRASLGDKQCRIDLAGRTMRTTVLSSNGNLLTLDRPAEERFLFGRLRFLSGANCGIASVVLGVNGDEVSLRDRPAQPVAAGSVVELREGCDKRFETCVSRFQNAANFRGEPHLPGTDLLTRYPGA